MSNLFGTPQSAPARPVAPPLRFRHRPLRQPHPKAEGFSRMPWPPRQESRAEPSSSRGSKT
jgi:hypothetical protein